MADRLHAMLRSHLRHGIEKQCALLPAGFRFQRQLRLVSTHHHHLIIDGPFALAARYPPPSYLNVGRFTAPTHHVYNFLVAFFYCLHMPRTVKLRICITSCIPYLLIRVFITIGEGIQSSHLCFSQPLCAITLHECDYR